MDRRLLTVLGMSVVLALVVAAIFLGSPGTELEFAL